MYDFGDGQPTKWSDATDADKGRFVSRDRWNAGVEVLRGEATKLQKAWADYHAGTGSRPTRPEPAQRPDLLAGIRDMPAVDGRSIEKLVQGIQQHGIGPMAQVMAQMATKIKQLESQLGTVSSTTGTLAEREQSTDFESYITRAFTDAGQVKGVPEGVTLDAQDPWLREAAKDLYLSHEPESWKGGAFKTALNKRIESAVAFVRSLDAAAQKAALERKKTWFKNPTKGQGRGSGDARYKFERGNVIAARYFGGEPANT